MTSENIKRKADVALVADAAQRLRVHVLESIETKRRLLETAEEPILNAAKQLVACMQEGGKLFCYAEMVEAPPTVSTSRPNS